MKYQAEPDQIKMTKHLRSRRRAMLFVGMGRGKTAATLDAIQDIICDTAGGALVIAPLNVVLLTWPSEIKLWDQFRWMKVANLRTSEGMAAWFAGTADIYLINWEAIPRFIEKVMVYAKTAADIPVNTVVYDELSKAKSHSSKRVNKWRRFTYLFKYHIGLTGTPNPNSYLDLFAQFRLICGQKSPLGTAFEKFKQKFFQPADWNQYKWKLCYGAEREIENLIAPYVFSLGAGEFPSEVIDEEVTMPDTAVKFYKKLEKDLLAQMGDKEVTAANAAVLVMKLLQVTSGCVYNEIREQVVIHTGKIEALKRIVKENKGQPVMVATMFKHERSRIMEAFPKAELFCNKESELARWNAGKIPMWIIDPRSAGHGLNLQHGGHIIAWMSQTYSREMWDQTNARLARKGQKHTVKIYRLLCPLTVDDAVAAVLEHKGSQQRGLLTALQNIRTLHNA